MSISKIQIIILLHFTNLGPKREQKTYDKRPPTYIPQQQNARSVVSGIPLISYKIWTLFKYSEKGIDIEVLFHISPFSVFTSYLNCLIFALFHRLNREPLRLTVRKPCSQNVLVKRLSKRLCAVRISGNSALQQTRQWPNLLPKRNSCNSFNATRISFSGIFTRKSKYPFRISRISTGTKHPHVYQQQLLACIIEK